MKFVFAMVMASAWGMSVSSHAGMKKRGREDTYARKVNHLVSTEVSNLDLQLHVFGALKLLPKSMHPSEVYYLMSKIFKSHQKIIKRQEKVEDTEKDAITKAFLMEIDSLDNKATNENLHRVERF